MWLPSLRCYGKCLCRCCCRLLLPPISWYLSWVAVVAAIVVCRCYCRCHHAAAAAFTIVKLLWKLSLPLLYALCAVRCVAHCLLPHAVAFQNWRMSALLLIEQNWHHRPHFLVITAHALHAAQDIAHCLSLPTAWLPVTAHRLQNFRCCWLIYRIASRSADCTQNGSNFNFSLSHGATWIPIKVLDSSWMCQLNRCSTWSRPEFMMSSKRQGGQRARIHFFHANNRYRLSDNITKRKPRQD